MVVRDIRGNLRGCVVTVRATIVRLVFPLGFALPYWLRMFGACVVAFLSSVELSWSLPTVLFGRLTFLLHTVYYLLVWLVRRPRIVRVEVVFAP